MEEEDVVSELYPPTCIEQMKQHALHHGSKKF